MSAKRPRPAIPVLVHVDNPAEVGSVTVDTSTVEEKMDTVINNQERIYNKIPTSSGGSSADLTTVNANTTALAEAIGTTGSSLANSDLIGLVKNLRSAVGLSGTGLPLSSDSVRSFLYNLREAVGNSINEPTATETTVRGLLTAIKENTASGGGGGGSGGSADLTTVNEKTTALAAAIGSASDDASTVSVIGLLKSIADKY